MYRGRETEQVAHFSFLFLGAHNTSIVIAVVVYVLLYHIGIPARYYIDLCYQLERFLTFFISDKVIRDHNSVWTLFLAGVKVTGP